MLFRLEDKPQLTDRPPDDMALEDEVISRIAAGSGVLAALRSEGGLDDRQAFHALMLLIRTGRRMNDLLHLDQRADRVLPNGWCILPPRQVCAKGNACLTCDKFVTDASHRAELQHRLAQTEALISRRQTQFTARHGEPMGEDNVWLADRLAETRALSKVLVALDQVSVHEDGHLRAVRGAGAADRPEPPSTTRHQEPTA